MKSRRSGLERVLFCKVLWGILSFFFIVAARAQTDSRERSFPQSKAAVEHAVKKMQSDLAGRLPILEGFAKAGELPLDRYERGFYQATIHVSSSVSGGSVARVSVKVTAWCKDPRGSRSGYQVLTSNGRLEADLLDQLAQLLATGSTEGSISPASVPKPGSPPENSSDAQAIPSPAPQFPTSDQTFSSSLRQGLSFPDTEKTSNRENAGNTKSALQMEADSLEEILKNQAHPKNLVAVKKSGTPVVATPSLNAKPEFLASMHDEFELLNFNADWVHVRISGLSRGWIWRNSVEMPDGVPDTEATPPAATTPAADAYHVTREETAPFPGDWEPLRNKNVKIITVQKTDDKTQSDGPQQRLDYAKFLFEKSYKEMAQKQQDLAGIVVIFDSNDGGMIAVPMVAVQQWKAGTLSDSALWHKCFFDPPEIFDLAAPSRGQ